MLEILGTTKCKSDKALGILPNSLLKGNCEPTGCRPDEDMRHQCALRAVSCGHTQHAPFVSMDCAACCMGDGTLACLYKSDYTISPHQGTFFFANFCLWWVRANKVAQYERFNQKMFHVGRVACLWARPKDPTSSQCSANASRGPNFPHRASLTRRSTTQPELFGCCGGVAMEHYRW